MPQEDNVLVNSPHTVHDICDDWNHPYSKKVRFSYPME